MRAWGYSSSHVNGGAIRCASGVGSSIRGRGLSVVEVNVQGKLSDGVQGKLSDGVQGKASGEGKAKRVVKARRRES